MLVSLGLAVMLIVSVALLEPEPARASSWTGAPGSAPAFFFIDIQPDQAEPFARLVADHGATAPAELTPVVRSRLAAINGALDRRRTRARDARTPGISRASTC